MEQLLSTKFFIPSVRSELVTRSRLIDQLNEGIHRKLTLISAPAGFGKTTLATEWLDNLRGDKEEENQTGGRIAWLSLDEHDNDPVDFLEYLISALNRAEGIENVIGAGALSMLQSPQPPPSEIILTSLINELIEIPDKFLFVLDDYHVIAIQSIHDAVNFFLEHLPPQMHLIIVTREDPPFRLSRLRVQEQMSELRAADLRFSPTEAAKFLNQIMGLDLSTNDIAKLESRTEGWVAGLQLAAISLKGKEDSAKLIESFSSSHRLVLDYLMEEVLDQQSPEIQSFLLQTAVLDRLTGSLCDELTGQSNSQATLDILERANLFINPIGNERRWFRYHHLFADMLRQRLHLIHPEKLSVLHLRASEWYEKNGFIDDAIEHVLRIKDYERAVRLVGEQCDAIGYCGEEINLRRWLDKLPVEMIYSNPYLCICHAWNLFTSGQLDEAEKCLQASEQATDFSVSGATEPPQTKELQTPCFDNNDLRQRASAIRAFVASYRSGATEIIKQARQTLEYLPEQDLSWRSTINVVLGDAYSLVGDWSAAYRTWLEALEASKVADNIYLNLIANLNLAVALRQQGQREQAIDICRQQFQIAEKNGLLHTAVVGWLLAIWGISLADAGDLDSGLQKTKQGVSIAERSGDIERLGWSYLSLIRVLLSMGDMSGAEEIIRKLEDLDRNSTVPPWIMNHMMAYQAKVWLAQGRLDAASEWLEERDLKPDAYLGGLDYGAVARILIAQGRLDETISFLGSLIETAEAGGHIMRRMELLALQALAYQANDDIPNAIIVLERALILAERGGYTQVFLDEGRPMQALLKKIKVEDVRIKEYVRNLVVSFSSKEGHHSSPSDQPLIEPLSEREIDVLQLMAEGLTNQAIASRLFLSLNTIKAHTRNIYGKLGVNNRTQAAAKAKEIGILPST